MSTPKDLPLDDTSRSNPDLWPQLSNADWVTLHVPRFGDLRGRFEACTKALNAVLNHARKKLAPEAIIQVRAKEVPSFAEKILRKKSSYTDPKNPLPPDPLMRLTDLCGGRVICQTEEQVQAVTAYLEQHFEIDWANSDDAGERLLTSEFGYRTINRIVSFKAGTFPAEIVPPELCAPVALPGLDAAMSLKMEIQVRTLLAHAWADTAHDHFYKTDIKVPERLKRDLASKAAILEETDRDIARLLATLEDYRSNYGAHHSRKKVEDEIALQRIVLAQMEKPDQRTTLAVKIAKLCMAIGGQENAIQVLAPFAEQTRHHAAQRTLGQALTELHQDQPASEAFKAGRNHLQHATTCEGADAETFCMLGEAALLCHDDEAAAEAYHQAITRDATEPGSLARYLEHEVALHRDRGLVRLAKPMIRNAMHRCRTQIEGCVNLPGAWAALSLMHILVKEPHAALDALAHLMSLCESRPDDHPPQPCTAARHVLRLHQAMQRLASIQESLPGYAAMERALLLSRAVRGRDAAALAKLQTLASWTDRGESTHLNANISVVIVAGGCSTDVETLITDLEPHLRSAFVGLPLEERPLAIISGGTKAGISRLVGDVVQTSGGRIKAYGYLPKTVPSDYRVDHDKTRYTLLRESPGNDFTALDPLQGWTDLAAAGVDLKRIKLLAFAPGEISRVEMAFALALGVRVGLIDHPALPPKRQFDDASWLDHLEEGSLIRLPLDAMTLRAFLLTDTLPDADERFEAAARQVHESYLKSARPADPSLSPWEKLPPELKVSNYHQAAYWANILATEGLGVRKFATADAAPVLDIKAAIGEAGVKRLAEMEHGRWNVERLLRGWCWAEKKDVAKKLSPYLVRWDALSAEIQGYDIDAIINLPNNLLAAGFEVYLLEKNP
jgi:ppGpp synthetase/RelA/SpoT-type nucleotidyltranferase